MGLFIGEPVNPFHMQLAQAIDRELADAGLDSVVSLRALSDASALTEVDRLLGHRRIAHIGGTDEVSAKERTAAYRAAMEGAGLAPTVFSAGHDVNSGRRGIEYLMSQPTRRLFL